MAHLDRDLLKSVNQEVNSKYLQVWIHPFSPHVDGVATHCLKHKLVKRIFYIITEYLASRKIYIQCIGQNHIGINLCH